LRRRPPAPAPCACRRAGPGSPMAAAGGSIGSRGLGVSHSPSNAYITVLAERLQAREQPWRPAGGGGDTCRFTAGAARMAFASSAPLSMRCRKPKKRIEACHRCHGRSHLRSRMVPYAVVKVANTLTHLVQQPGGLAAGATEGLTCRVTRSRSAVFAPCTTSWQTLARSIGLPRYASVRHATHQF
jgi:hypothetical protein